MFVQIDLAWDVGWSAQALGIGRTHLVVQLIQVQEVTIRRRKILVVCQLGKKEDAHLSA